MADELVGKTLGKYRILNRIGAGGMGTVYEGRHETLEQKVAVKVLAPQLAMSEDAVRRFLQEGRFVARLRHNGIVTVYDLGEEDGVNYLAMEFVEGKPLSALIERWGKVKPVRALDITRQVADALAIAHEQSVVHRDIKPDNIMVNQAGKVKVMDFGIAKEIDTGHALTMEGASVGTLLYMSPEQCKGASVDGRSDIFSLGVVLFESLTGRLPYSPNLAHLDLMNKIVNGPFPSPRYVDSEITEAVENLVMRMTAINPEERYESATELSDDIRHLIRTKGYRAPRTDEMGSSGLSSIKKLFKGGTKPETEIENRSSTRRRKEDRQLLEELEQLRKAVENYQEGKRQQRYAVRRKCKALLHEGCQLVEDIDLDSTTEEVKLLDLSEGGTALFIKRKLAKESRHVIELHLEGGHIVRSPAEVTWTRYVEKREGYATGFRFVQVPDDDEQHLMRALTEIRKSSGL